MAGKSEKDSQFVLKTNMENQTSVLSLTGNLNIQQSIQLKEALVNALQSSKICMLDMKNVTHYDLSIIQLIYSAYKTAKDSGQEVTVLGEFPQIFISAVDDAGYSDFEWLCFGNK